MGSADLFEPSNPDESAETEDEKEVVAAIYARTSSVNQQFGYSLDGQVKKCYQRCENRGWTVSFVYRDEAESGGDRDRPMFQEMMSKAEQGLFDVVVFWKLDRFSRSLMHAVQLEDKLREQDIALHSVTEQIDTTTPAGRFNFRNIANAAEFERDMIQQRTKMGMKTMANEHKWPNDRPPLGYRKRDDDRLAVVDEEAELVQRIFDLYVQKRSMPEVARTLNDEGVETKRGNEWTPRAVGKVLRNELYTGKYAVADVEDYVSDYQIIDKALFEEVTTIRHRFQSEKTSRSSMNSVRKKENVETILTEYREYLSETGK